MEKQNKSSFEKYQEGIKEGQVRKEKTAKEAREKQAEEREHQGFQISKNSYVWAKRAIWISVILACVQIGISYYDIWWKDNEHETTMIKQNSIQIEQNKKIIELLENSIQKDSIKKSPQ